MAVLRRFFCFELEATASFIGSIVFFWSLELSVVAINNRHASAVLYLIFLLASGLLIYGTIKRNQYFLLPWLIIHFAVCVLAALMAALIYGNNGIMKGENTNHSHRYGMLESEAMKKKNAIVIFKIIFGIGYALVVYMFMAIASLYSKLRDENQQKAETC